MPCLVLQDDLAFMVGPQLNYTIAARNLTTGDQSKHCCAWLCLTARPVVPRVLRLACILPRRALCLSGSCPPMHACACQAAAVCIHVGNQRKLTPA